MTQTVPKYVPQLRAEKTTKNRDDLRVMIAGLVFCILLIMMQTVYSKVYDILWAERPFVTATIELVFVSPDLPPLVKYDADANQDASGTWIASVYTADGTRLNSRRGEGNYNNFQDDPKYWSWGAWFDNEQSDPPAVPNEPFYVCVRYDVVAKDSGVGDNSDKFCSNVYDPNNPHPQLTEIIEKEIIR